MSESQIVHISRPEFESSAREIVDLVNNGEINDPAMNHLFSWEWKPVKSLPAGYGYLERQGHLLSKSENNIIYSVQLWVTYSASYRVPNLLFNISDQSGIPLTFSEIMEKTSFFYSTCIPMLKDNEQERKNDSDEAANFPIILQEQHPVLGISCLSLHPCENPNVLAQILYNQDKDYNNDKSQSQLDEQTTKLLSRNQSTKLFVIWFMIVSTLVDLRYI